MFLMFSCCSILYDFSLTVFLSLPFLAFCGHSGKQLDVSANGLGVDGGKAIAASIAENRTITSVSYQQKAFSSTFLTCLSLPLVSAFSILWGK